MGISDLSSVLPQKVPHVTNMMDFTCKKGEPKREKNMYVSLMPYICSYHCDVSEKEIMQLNIFQRIVIQYYKPRVASHWLIDNPTINTIT